MEGEVIDKAPPVSAGEKEHYRRGKHPNTERAIAPYRFQPGVSGNPAGGQKGTPLFPPRMRHYLAMSIDEIKVLYEERYRFPAADAICIVMIHKAITEGSWGDVTRQDVIKVSDRGSLGEPLVNVNADQANITIVRNIPELDA